ncbi:MAG: hypothetical protein WDW38_003132 [Sanguina aurantia]
MPKVTPLSVHLKFQGRCDYPVPPGVDDWGLTKDQQESYVEQFRRILLAKNAFDSEEHEERLLKFHVQEYERATRVILPVCCKLFAKPIDTTFGILDVKGVGMSHLSSEVKRLLGIITKIDSNNYPETMGHMCIINAPGIFRLMWSIIKGMLDPRTQSKIEILGPNYKEGLLRWIDEENIPEWMGGSSKGGLVDDVGPWSDPDVLTRLELDVETLRRGRRVSVGSQMAAVSIRRAQSLASRQGSLTAPSPTGGAHESSGTQQQHRLGVVVEDAHLHPTTALHPTPSIQRPSVATLADSFDTTNTNGASTSRGPVTLASLADLLSTDKPRTLVERITALEKLMPGQLERLKMQVGAANVAHSAAMSTRSAPEGSLLNRVETLEDALTTLLAAQEVCIQQQQADQALCEMRAQQQQQPDSDTRTTEVWVPWVLRGLVLLSEQVAAVLLSDLGVPQLRSWQRQQQQQQQQRRTH